MALTGGRIVDKNYCEACRHWMIKRKNRMGEYVADDMTIKGGWGTCRFDERWRYFSYCKKCSKGKFEPIEEPLRKKREAWRIKKEQQQDAIYQKLKNGKN